MVPSLFRLTKKDYQSSSLLALCDESPPQTDGFPLQIVLISWRHHNIYLHMGVSDVSCHWSRDCLFSRLFRLTATKRQRLLITARGPSNANELPLHRASDIESVSMLWRQLEGWQPSFIISLVVVRWLIYVTKLDGLSFGQWLGSCLVMRPANIPWSILLGIITIR